MSDKFFNTIGLTGEALWLANRDAGTQEDIILAWFKWQRPHGSASPSEIHRKALPERVPLTSVRRAITNLTNDRRLVKTGKQVKGIYGKPEHCWRLPQHKPMQAILFGEHNENQHT